LKDEESIHVVSEQYQRLFFEDGISMHFMLPIVFFMSNTYGKSFDSIEIDFFTMSRLFSQLIKR